MRPGTMDVPPVNPHDALGPFRRHAEWALVAATAQELGIYDALADGPASLAELAERLELDRRGLRILLGALDEMGLVRREEDGWRLTGEARARLVDPDTPDYQADALRLWLRNIRGWARELPMAVRTGAAVDEEDGPDPADAEGDAADEEEHLAAFMAAMANKNPDLVEAVVDGCLERRPDAATLLDLGGGPGTVTRAFAARGLAATLFDRPEVIDHVADRYGLVDVPEITLARGDFTESLPEHEYDIVLLANITHIYAADENRSLLARAAGCVAPGGVLAILDFVRGEEPFASLFAITMLLNTERGETYPLAAYRDWLGAAGLREVRCRTLREDRQLVTARRPEA